MPPDSFPLDEREQSLVAGLARGDNNAVREFMIRTHRPVYCMTARLTHDPDLRHDWTHEVLLRIVDELGRGRFVYRWPGCFWSWFQKRSYFLLINLFRRQQRYDGRWTSGDEGEDIIDRMGLPNTTDPSRMIENLEARTIVEQCLEKLDREDHRTALHLLLFEDLSYQEIADHLGAPLNTVRSWIRRARTAMRESLADHYELES